MNILVIGGSKFIGWRLVKLLGKTNHNVTVINRGNHPRNYPRNVVHHIADRSDYSEMSQIVEKETYDVVFDMCGFTKDDMTHTVRLFSDRAKKYVFISTAATYVEPLTMPIFEDYQQGIHGVWGKYGSGKLDCESLLLSAYAESNFPAVIVRPSYVYGVDNSIDRETFLFDRITNNRTILIPGDGEAVIQLGEVSDLCQALLNIAETPKGVGECYNISGNEFITLNSLVRMVSKIVGKDCKTIHVKTADYGFVDRDIFPFDNASYVTSCKKFSEEFGWTPKISLEVGLSAAYKAWVNSIDRRPANYEKEDAILARL